MPPGVPWGNSHTNQEAPGEGRRSSGQLSPRPPAPRGRFGFQAVLPSGVNFEDVSAALADGVLTISVPWAQATTGRVGERPP
ncbi:Hsp20 family protein [Streptomyces lavendulae]|uniref:Hsp20 family protein n=1 Tax=Streptomyces lavendulae TaxID=1914 RepID=UPI0033DF03DB